MSHRSTPTNSSPSRRESASRRGRPPSLTGSSCQPAEFPPRRRIRSIRPLGKRASTTATALLEALQHLKVTRIAIGAPYDKVVSEIASRFLQGNGIEVVATQELGLKQNLDVGRLLPQSAYDMGLKLDCPQAQAIVFAGTNWSTMAITEQLEAKIGKPVISTTAAALWSALRMVGWRGSLAAQGRLLSAISE